ncbi:MAG: DUF721 domain-containing protein [Planctomycetaceae bacterium]|nr:DUF721 domain-containing protein [Planctomycetaceae bacterium]
MNDDDLTHRPRHLSSLVSNLIRRRGLTETSATASLDAHWKQVVGEEIGRHCWARGVKAGVLDIAVTNSAVLEQLRSFMHMDVLQQMQNRVPESNIKNLRYTRVR